jgi:hypothetical protein
MNHVCSFVQEDKAMQRWREEDKELVISTLSKRADGMRGTSVTVPRGCYSLYRTGFRWIFCQLDTLRGCIPPSIRKALDELPITLDGTYERTLQCIPEEQREHGHRLFQCLIAAIRPLRLEALAEMLAIQFDSNVSHNLVEG